jgi:hypothetical protein
MKHIVYILLFLFLIFFIHFYTTRKIESFKIEPFNSQCPNLDRIKNYVQQYLPDDDSWENIVREVETRKVNEKKDNDHENCLSTDGWTNNCVQGKTYGRDIRTPRICKKRVDFNCEATDNCKWFYGFCENKNFKQQIEDPFSFRTRNWWQNRIAGYPNISYNDSRDGFIKIPNDNLSLKKDIQENNQNIDLYYRKTLSDLMSVINDPYSDQEQRQNARKYLRELRSKMRGVRGMMKRSERASDPKSVMFGNQQLCNKNYTRNCFFSNKYNTFIDNMGSIWHKEKGDNYVMWDQVVGGANSTDSTGLCGGGKV